MVDNDSRNLLPWIVSMIAVTLVSCGKAGSPGAVTGFTLIDNMGEDGREDGHILWPPPEGLQPGFWTSTTNCLQDDQILPEPYFLEGARWAYDQVPHVYQTMPGVTSTHAARLRTKFGEPLQNVWGANIGFDFAERAGADGAAPEPSAAGVDAGSTPDGEGCRQGSSRDFAGALVDLSKYSGFTFWAMASPNGRQSIRVQLNNSHTDPRGGECTSGDPSNPEEHCYNGYGKSLLLTSTFTQYWVAFSELRQDPGWEHLGPEQFQPADGVFSMNFEVPLPGCVTDGVANCAGGQEPVSFDVWIDDLYFVDAPLP